MSTSCQSRRRASARPTRRLAGSHEADQIHLVGFHATSRRERLEETGIGDGDRRRRRRSATAIRAGERGDGERHRHPVIAVGVGLTAAGGRSRRLPRDDEAVRTLVGVDAERAEPGDERGDAVAFLDAQLGGAADASPRRRAPASAAIAGSSSMSPGTSSGAMSTRPMRSPSTMMVPTRLAGVARRLIERHPGAEAAQDARAAPSASGSGRRPRFRRATRAAPPPPPSRTRRTRSRRGRRASGRRASLPAGDGDARAGRVDVDAAAERHAARARCGRASAPARSTVVVPVACRPASSTALFTCALGDRRVDV